jgi:hypothetical protein
MLYVERTCDTFLCESRERIPGDRLIPAFSSLRDAANWVPLGWVLVGKKVVCRKCYGKIDDFILGYATIKVIEPNDDIPRGPMISPPPISTPDLSDTPTE